MSDILKDLEGYPDDPTVVMSRRLIGDVVAEIKRLRNELADAREESERLRWSCSAKDDVARKIAEIHRTNLAAKNENLRDMMFRAYQEGWNSSLSYVGEDDMIDAWEESAAKARIDAFLD
jgi:hypothetical protein